jgi:hypothetical protein
MRKSKNRVSLRVEAIESRALLSALAPGPSVPVRNTVVADVEPNAETLAQDSISSVNIQNNTIHILVVKAVLKIRNPPRPIEWDIPARGGSRTFDFKRDVDAFIWIDVMRKGGAQPPRPLKDYPLNKPDGGYNGMLFQISTDGRVYSVTG